MKKNLQVIGYQPDRLCTLKDLEVFDRTWWAQKPIQPFTYTPVNSTFKVTQEIKQAFAGSFDFINSLHKL